MKSCSPGFLPSLAVLLCFLISCNNDGTRSATSNEKDTSSKNVNVLVTKPQYMVVITHRVNDFNAWQRAYDKRRSAREQNGLRDYIVYYGANDPNLVMITLNADDLDRAKKYVNDSSFTKALKQDGAIDTPSIEYITTTFQYTAVTPSELRALTTFQVKDWAAWEANFQKDEQDRIDSGMITRLYGHDAYDKNKVRLVLAVLDSAKSRSYWKSDLLKKRRAAGGVIGEPERLLFRVAQRS